MITLENGMPRRPLKEAVFFAFDNHSIPWTTGVELHLISSKPYPFLGNPIVLDRGPEGAPDSGQVHYRGTTLRVGEDLWMYYWGCGRDTSRLCLAKSRDGVAWERPDLGLVEYNGSKHNNLLDVPGEPSGNVNLVLEDPEDPDPGKRFKMLSGKDSYFSADGLRWRPTGNPGPSLAIAHGGLNLEWGGVIKLNGMFYVTGQRGFRRYARSWARRLVVMMSPDFINWCDTGGFVALFLPG